MAASRWARQCCEIRGSRQWSCASVSRRIGARKAGPPAADRSARQTSNAAPMPHWCIEMSLFAELKRRNVFRAAAFYAASAWLLVQIATQVFPFFHIAEWVVRWIVVAASIGFPFAMLFSWFYEWTPHGIQRESEIPPNESITRQTGKKLDRWIIAILALAVVLLLADKFVLHKDAETAAAATTEKSIAVLPFDNLSRDPDNAYFCEGVQDEILTRLAKVADLKVISRTSTQHFKSTPENLPEIAKQLGVTNILEGSVQKAADQVRVNVQLINAMTDAHVWADTYDRKLTDIFAVESEIAKNIAETLQARLSGSEKSSIAKTPTVNAEAYELYLKGRFFWNKRTGTDLRKAIDYFNQAIAKDPNYALAYVGLADSYLLLSSYAAVSPAESLPPARSALKKALELDDSLAEAHASFGLLTTLELDLHRALDELKRAVELKPNYATAHHWLALAHLTLAQFDSAISEAKRAIELDPLSLVINADTSWIYFSARRYDEAEEQVRKTLEIGPQFFLAHYYFGEVLQFKGRLGEAIAEFQKAFELNNDPYSLAMLGQAYARNGQKDEAQKILARLNEEAKSNYVAPYALALVQIALGDKDRSIEELERAYAQGETNYLFAIKVDPMLDDLRGDPRFEALADKIVSVSKK